MGAFLILPLALAAQTSPADSCSVTGQVTNASTGEPVRRALVALRRVDTSPGVTNVQVTQSGTTDAAGRFALTGIEPGKYRLSAEHNGFLNTQYGARGPNKPGTLLTLEPGQKSSDLALRLTPHGVITGTIVDDEGEPVSGADIQVLRQQYMQGRKQLVRSGGAVTNDLGEYRIFGLAPGRYFLGATARQNPVAPQTEDDYVTTYFPRTTDSAAAGAIDLSPGVQLRNIDIALGRLHTVTVRGRVINETRPAPGTNLSAMLTAQSGTAVAGIATRGSPVSPQGTFEFRNVAPGSYFVVGAVHMPGKSYTTRTPIQVGASNIEGLLLTVTGGVTIAGKVRVEGETAESIAKVHVNLQPADLGGIMFGPLPNQQVRDDGSFQMEDVVPDRYTLTLTGLPEGFYVTRIRSANLDVLSEGLDVSGAVPAPLDVVLSPKAAQVSGTVMDPKTQKAAPATTVVLVPQEKERRNRESFYRVATTDVSGQFTIKSMVPGEYRAYAWEEAEYGAWLDPDFIKVQESRGETVSLPEGARQAIQLNLIPADSQ
jgi:protocatechuate 3,4-dioxygenase beta subunit